jgi:transposase
MMHRHDHAGIQKQYAVKKYKNRTFFEFHPPFLCHRFSIISPTTEFHRTPHLEVTPWVRERHRSKEFVEFLGILDDNYPKDWKIRMLLDNHSARISKDPQKYLKNNPDRFEFVFTPEHGSWLNLIEMFFSKIARSFLRHIRVQSKEKLGERIYQGIGLFNREPVIFRWRYKWAK